jgi:Fe-S oxidoreductase
MLTQAERILFVIASLVTIILTIRATARIVRIIDRGVGKPDWNVVPSRLIEVAVKTISFSPVFRTRKLTSWLHGFVAWGFIYYLLVNLGDVLRGYIVDFQFFGEGTVGDLYRLGGDVLSVITLVGMLSLLLRRFVFRPPSLNIRGSTLLNPKARNGIRRDSLIVGLFILLHVGARFIGESFELALNSADIWQPFASGISGLWASWDINALELARHSCFWVAFGVIMAFFPYFPYSKHIHLFTAPINYLLQTERRSIGELTSLDFEDETIEQFGAEKLEDLSWSALLDGYACIMCNRCQDACPAYETGKVLSPAALEINKRYFLNQEGTRLANGQASAETLLEYAITEEAVWACTACGACNDICPVGNEPMHDILDIRRHLVLMENKFPEQLQAAFRGMERVANPWSVSGEERLRWAEGLDVPTIQENPDAEFLWWVGCAPATDARAQKTAIAFVKVLQEAGINYAVLGTEERCTGDSARRAGNEFLFNELALGNVDTLNQLSVKRIITTCPHCLHTLKNEYPAFGGNYEVIHHTQLIEELIQSQQLKLKVGGGEETITFHDPCYLGRHNQIIDPPRSSMVELGVELLEMSRSGSDSFCCGAGGGQMWKEEEEGKERVSFNRLNEAQAVGATELALACPFCMVMFEDAAGATGNKIQIRDVVEIIADRVEGKSLK